ncbi:MAG: molybdopterin-dependent oxidoreductase, partial [Gammaproteobacteria bacterium]|nr:molybdopterin-dependent oxidoreductase [Gammaproteobacteria bacterium]
RYSGRPWENQQHNSIAPHDCVGSNIVVETRRNQVMRVLPRENESINETWLSDRDRFSYTALNSEQRLTAPMIKQGNSWRTVDWETALAYAVEGLQRAKQVGGADKLGALCSSSATTEEMYLLQKLLRGLGSPNIDHRLRQIDFADQDVEPMFPWLGQSIVDLENLDAALLIGSNVRKDQPLVAHRLRKAALKGGKIMFVNALGYEFNFPVAEQLVASPIGMVKELAAVCKALTAMNGAQVPAELAALLSNVEPHDSHLTIAKHLATADNAAVLIGTQAMGQAELSVIRALANAVAQYSKAKLGYLSPGANSTGAYLSGCLPHRGPAGEKTAPGLHAQEMLNQAMTGMVLLQVEPEFDCADPMAAVKNLQAADFVVCLNAFVTDTMKSYADVLLPVSAFTETPGTYVNVEGLWQSFPAAVKPEAESRPAWKVLRVMGNLFKLSGFDYMSSEEVRDQCHNQASSIVAAARSEWHSGVKMPQAGQQMIRIGYLPIYAVDSLTRRAAPLQNTRDAVGIALHINSATLQTTKLGNEAQGMVTQQSAKATMPIVQNESIPDHCVMVATGVAGSEQLGISYGPVELSKS